MYTLSNKSTTTSMKCLTNKRNNKLNMHQTYFLFSWKKDVEELNDKYIKEQQ